MMRRFLLPVLVVLVPIVVIGAAVAMQILGAALLRYDFPGGHGYAYAGGNTASGYDDDSMDTYVLALGIPSEQVTRIVTRLQRRPDDDLRLMAAGFDVCGQDCEALDVRSVSALAGIELADRAARLQVALIAITGLALLTAMLLVISTIVKNRRDADGAKAVAAGAGGPMSGRVGHGSVPKQGTRSRVKAPERNRKRQTPRVSWR
jgi:hypothetical protein